MRSTAMRLFGLVATGLFLLIAVVTTTTPTTAAPLAAISLGSTYTQNFDTLANTGTTNAWADDSTIPGWYSTRTVYLASTGSLNNGGLYSFGNAGETERALGSVGSGGTGTINYGARFVNDTGSTINSITVSYTGEQWRNGGNTTQHVLEFQYQLNAPDISTGTWTDVDALDFTGPIATATAGAINPPATANLSATFNVAVPAGGELWIRWQDIDNTGSDHGLAIDNLTVSAGGGSTPTATVSPSVTNTPGGPTTTPTATTAPTNTPTATASPTPGGTCGSTATLISAIQGSGTASPLAGNGITYSIEGLVVGDFQGAGFQNGFYVMEEASDFDSNPATSEGIFVFSNTAVNAGDKVRVAGRIVEFSSASASDGGFFNMTQMSNVASVVVCSTGNTLVPVDATLPEAVNGDLERYEGMLVRFNQTLTVSQNYFLGRYGQMTLSAPLAGSPGRMYQPTNGNGLGDTVEGNARRFIVLDDGRTGSPNQNPNPVPYLPNPFTPGVDTLRSGDTTTGLTGILDNGKITNAGVGDYRIHPTTPVTFTNVNTRLATPEPVGGTLRVTSFNVLNYFNGNGQGGGFPTSRGASTLAEFNRQRTKIISALAAINADVIGLMEIENDGTGSTSAIQDLVNGLNAQLGAGTYAFVTEPAPGTDEIKVAMIYKPGSVTPIGATLNFQTNAGGYTPLFDRPPLAQTFEQISTGERFTFVVNHFKSKGCGDASGPDADTGQGCWNNKRIVQAQQLSNWINTTLSAVDRDVVTMGDYNSYGAEDPILELEDNGLTSMAKTYVPAEQRYSYIFDGFAGELDHGFVTPSLLLQSVNATIWHINADESPALDYDQDFNVPGYYSPDPYRSSDHDPVIIGLDLTPTEVTFSSSDYEVAESNTTATITVTLSRPTDIDVVLDYNTEDGTATAGEDYVATSGTLTITEGMTSTTFTVEILDDTDAENDETVILEVSPDVVPGLGVGGVVTSTLTILENAPTTVDFSAENYTVTEAETTVPVTVTLSQALTTDVAVEYSTSNGTATAGQDYVSTSGTITFTAGTTSQNFNVAILDDATIEPNETVILELTPGTIGLGTDVVTATLTIQDNAPIAVDFSTDNYSVTEANTTQVVTVTLSAPLDVDVGLDYSTANSTATAGQDYVAESGTITFTAGSTVRTFDVAILDDSDDEPNETFTVQVDPGTLGLLGDVATATVTIIDNDAPPTAVTLGALTADSTATPWLALFGAAGLLLAGVLVWRKR